MDVNFITEDCDALWFELIYMGLFEARREKALTLKDVSQKTGLTVEQIDTIEMLRYPLKVEDVLALAGFYDRRYKIAIQNGLQK